MDYVRLGNTELIVSRLCFGGLTVGPLQANLSLEDGAKVIAEAFDTGINFIDTAKFYRTYPYIKRALEISNNKNIIIASKSYDYTYEGMKESVNESLEQLGVKSIGIFSLHEQESKLTLKGHEDALRYLIEAKRLGLIKAVGISTHAVEVVNAVSEMPEIDVIHPIVNIKGLGIIDGTISDMLNAVERAHKSGKGIYAMKPLGGGNLMKSADECFDFVLNNKFIHSIAVGMQTLDEVKVNTARFEGRQIDNQLLQKLINRKKNLHIDEWCQGCGRCVEVCKSKALKIEKEKAIVLGDKCVLCGYCSAYCPDFCIKIV